MKLLFMHVWYKIPHTIHFNVFITHVYHGYQFYANAFIAFCLSNRVLGFDVAVTEAPCCQLVASTVFSNERSQSNLLNYFKLISYSFLSNRALEIVWAVEEAAIEFWFRNELQIIGEGLRAILW